MERTFEKCETCMWSDVCQHQGEEAFWCRCCVTKESLLQRLNVTFPYNLQLRKMRRRRSV